MSSRKLQDANIRLQKAFTEANKEWEKLHPDLIAFITCSYRSPEEQHCLFISKPKVTNADSFQSPHNFNPSWAIDFAFKTKDGKVNWNTLYYIEFAKLMMKFDSQLEYGGNWKSIKDYPHIEIKNWKEHV